MCTRPDGWRLQMRAHSTAHTAADAPPFPVILSFPNSCLLLLLLSPLPQGAVDG
jgi:hypothetical protein